jgi:hypothetical protein
MVGRNEGLVLRHATGGLDIGYKLFIVNAGIHLLGAEIFSAVVMCGRDGETGIRGVVPLVFEQAANGGRAALGNAGRLKFADIGAENFL